MGSLREMLEETTPDHHWEKLCGVYKAVAMRHFERLPPDNSEHKQVKKWTLDMLEGLQLLKALKLYGNPNLTGNLSSLRVLKKLESVTLDDNPHLTGLELQSQAA